MDLLPATERTSSLFGLHQLEELLREAEIVEEGSLLALAAGALAGFAAAGFARVDHWEVRPGGWLPLHRVPRGPQVEPVRQFLDALRTTEWQPMSSARELAGRLSNAAGDRLEFVVRRLHRERQHTLSVVLQGRVRAADVESIAAAVKDRLPLLRARVPYFRVR